MVADAARPSEVLHLSSDNASAVLNLVHALAGRDSRIGCNLLRPSGLSE